MGLLRSQFAFNWINSAIDISSADDFIQSELLSGRSGPSSEGMEIIEVGLTFSIGTLAHGIPVPQLTCMKRCCSTGNLGPFHPVGVNTGSETKGLKISKI